MTEILTDQRVFAQLAERLGASSEGYMPKIMAQAANSRQARVLLELNQAPQPAKRAEEVAQALGLDAQTVAEDLELMFKRGLAFPRNMQNRVEWRFARSLGQIHDSMQCEKGTYSPADKEQLHELWRVYDENERFKEIAEESAKSERPPVRVIPAWRSVMNDPNLQPWEDWRQILKEQELISVVNCPCRPKMKKCDLLVEACIDFNRASEYDLASGHGRQLSYEEAVQMMDDAARDGLVHQAPNTRQLNMAMCNCCGDCCYSVVPLKMYGVPLSKMWAKSRYEAKIDQSTCTGCQKCVDRCMFDAISMVKVAGSKKMKAEVDPEACFGCGVCYMGCESESISMTCVRPVEHVATSFMRQMA